MGSTNENKNSEPMMKTTAMILLELTIETLTTNSFISFRKDPFKMNGVPDN